MNENVNLSDLMGNTPGRSTTVFDMTSGKGAVQTSTSDKDQVKKPAMHAVPVQSGPMDMNTIKPIDVNTILPKREPKVNAMEASMMADLDAAIDRECDKITELHQQIFAKQDEERRAEEERKEDERQAAEDDFALNGTSVAEKNDDSFDLYDDDANASDITTRPVVVNRFTMVDDDNEGTSFTTTTSTPITPIGVAPLTINKQEVSLKKENEDISVALSPAASDNASKNDDNKPVNILDNVKDEDLFDDEDEDSIIKSTDPEPTAEELLDDLKAQIKQRVAPVRKGLDLSKFTIAQKAISAQKVMKLAVHSHQNIADWVLPSAQRAISMTGLSGPEILKLNPENSNRNRQNTFRDMYRVIYDHVFDGNKPEFEVWLKQTRFVDLQHIYFALYMATFGGSNFINYSCPKCKKVFIQDIDFKDMVTYADDENETKAKIQSMLKMDTTSKSADSYESELIQVSDSYVFAIRTPSIWNVIMETASLSDQFLQKHADLIDMVAYIDAAYIIDHNNNQLIPVDTKPDPNDMAKTAARRIKAMYDIISTLSSEEFYALRNTINEYDEFANSSISYKIPACKCKHCGTEIPANTEITPDAMLFTRHQLAAIGNM